VGTPWQFYLYLGSILLLSMMGIAIQKCLNQRVLRGGKQTDGNGYYLEKEGSLREKLKKVFEFQ
jgi:hypothetical protein